jgi:branched-chain amino acid transport system substrate-binding protein
MTRERSMASSTGCLQSPSRRRVLRTAAQIGGALALGFPAPAILAQTRAPLRIGVLNTYTGSIAFEGSHALDGMNLYFDSIGRRIAGRPIELIIEDDQGSPQVGLQKIRKLVESDKVDLVCGPQASAVAMAILNYIKEHKAFLVVSGAGNDAITWQRVPYMFRTSITSWQIADPMGPWVYDNLGKEAVLLGSDNAPGHDVTTEFGASFIAKGGKVLKKIFPPFGTNDFSPYLTDLMSIGAPVSYSWFAGTDAVRFIQQYALLGIKKKTRMVGFAALIESTVIRAVGEDALGVITSTIYTDTLDNAANKVFVPDFHAKFEDYPDLFAEYGYTAAKVVAETLKATDGDTDKDKMAAAMVNVAFEAPRGPFRFDPVTHHPIQNVYVCEVQSIGGRLVDKDILTVKEVRDPGTKQY